MNKEYYQAKADLCYDVDIEAESEEQALDIFHSADFQGEPYLVGGELQDSVQIEELEEASV